MRFSVTGMACVAFGLLRDPCNGTDDPNGGPNAPCTRTSDCGPALSCIEGVCRGSAGDAAAPEDAGDGGG